MAFASRIIAVLDHCPMQVMDADRSLTFSAAHIKACYPVSYANAFTVALAQEKKGA